MLPALGFPCVDEMGTLYLYLYRYRLYVAFYIYIYGFYTDAARVGLCVR